MEGNGGTLFALWDQTVCSFAGHHLTVLLESVSSASSTGAYFAPHSNSSPRGKRALLEWKRRLVNSLFEGRRCLASTNFWVHMYTVFKWRGRASSGEGVLGPPAYKRKRYV